LKRSSSGFAIPKQAIEQKKCFRILNPVKRLSIANPKEQRINPTINGGETDSETEITL